jgi:hypothetical protein
MRELADVLISRWELADFVGDVKKFERLRCEIR